MLLADVAVHPDHHPFMAAQMSIALARDEDGVELPFTASMWQIGVSGKKTQKCSSGLRRS
jgi:hypothetical protein